MTQRGLASLLVLTVFVCSAQAKVQPEVTDITELVQTQGFDGSPGVELEGGTLVPLPEAAAPKTKVIFEDMMPGANWGHPAIIRVVRQGKEVLRRALSLPPRGLGKLKRKVKFGPPAALATPPVAGEPIEEAEQDPLQVKFAISELGGKYKIENPAKFHALLLNGNPNQRHWNDFAFMYRVLTTVYGYLPENIHVADSTNKDAKGDLDGSGKNRIAYSSTLKGVTDLFATLKDKLKAEDQLLIVVNDHGTVSENEVNLVLYDAEMKASRFAELVKTLPTKRIVAIFEQCFSGGFVRPMADDETVVLAASTNREFSWSTPDLRFDEFLYHVTAAFAHQTHEGKPVTADTNKNGKVSAQEAFSYAVEHDVMSESPVMEAAPNSGVATSIGLSF